MNYLKRAIGCSYCLDQSPGAERWGGLTVTIRWRGGETGTIVGTATSFRAGESLDESLILGLSKVAEEGLREGALSYASTSTSTIYSLSDFAYHPVDSGSEIYRDSARSAFRSAWEAWDHWYAASAEAWNRSHESRERSHNFHVRLAPFHRRRPPQRVAQAEKFGMERCRCSPRTNSSGTARHWREAAAASGSRTASG